MICFCAERFHWRRIWQNPGDLLPPGLSDMATRALLYRRPAEPAKLLVKHGSQYFAIRLRRHRRARRYTLRIHPTDREAILTMPPRGNLAEAQGVCAASRRLDRRPSRPFAEGGAVSVRHTGAAARCAAPAGASRRRARHGVDGNPRLRREDPLRRRRRRAYGPPGPRLSQARSAQGPAQGVAGLRRAARRQGQAGVAARSIEPLGFVHFGRLAVVFLAADPGAALCAGLSRGP